jgi:tellurite resistance protein TerC
VSDALIIPALAVGLLALLLVDLRFFARDREPTLREGAVWSIGWLVLSLLVTLVVLAVADGDAAVNYVTVYLIERSLSLDNLFVFLLLFTYFAVPVEERAALLFWGIAVALALRGLAIAGGVALINQFEFVLYVLGVLLLLLAWRIFRGVDEAVEPERNLAVRVVRRLFPVTTRYHGASWFVHTDGRRHATPLVLCFGAIVVADIAFAIDSIPAAFAITREGLVIWLGNIFALMGMRALFVLVEGLISRFRYLDQTIAIVLGVIALKLLLEDFVHVGPIASLAVVAVLFAGGIVASLVGDRRDPEAELKRELRRSRTAQAKRKTSPSTR